MVFSWLQNHSVKMIGSCKQEGGRNRAPGLLSQPEGLPSGTHLEMGCNDVRGESGLGQVVLLLPVVLQGSPCSLLPLCLWQYSQLPSPRHGGFR